VTTNF